MFRFRILVSLCLMLTCACAALAPAAPPDDFSLQGVTKETTFKLSDHKGRYVALHFLLKTECPFCIRHTTTYAQRADELPGVDQIFIKPDTPEEIKKWAVKVAKWSPVIYRDPDAALAEQFTIPGGYAFHGQSVHYPALVLLGPDGKEVFRYIGKNNSDRYPFDKLKEKISEVTRDPALSEWDLGAGNLAINGYDPVSYFGEGGLKKGKEDLTAVYRGVNYQFATPENRAAFAKEPQKYEPQCGGWCATAMINSQKVKADPENFKITNGKLFLFFKYPRANARDVWVKNEQDNYKAATRSWQNIVHKK